MTQTVLNQQPAAQEWGYTVINDFDGDGWPDILLGHHGDSTRPGYDNPSSYPYGLQLFQNNRDGTLAEVTGTYFPPIVQNISEHYHCCVAADVDGDGFEEFVIITGYRDDPTDTVGYPDHWFKTDTTPFTDVAPSWGTQDYPSKGSCITALPTSVAAGDPGTLGVLLANGEPNSTLGRIQRYHFWVQQNGVWTLRLPGNNDPDWTYIRANSRTIPAGIQGIPWNGDLVVRSSGINGNVWMLQQNGRWSFAQGIYVPNRLAALSPYHYDSEFVDVNNDGLPDLVAHDIGSGDVAAGVRVYLSDGTGWPTPNRDPNNSSFFAPTPPGPNSEGRSLAVGDFNNDGFPDIFALFSRGAVVDGYPAKGPDLLLQGDGTGNFTDVFAGSGLDGFLNRIDMAGGGGSAVVDIDMDGRLDLVVGYNELDYPGPFKVYKNVTQAGNFVGFILPPSVTIGAIVTISAPSGGVAYTQQVTARTGWMRQSSRYVHFGLGAYAGLVSVTVQWPDGTTMSDIVTAGAYYWASFDGCARFGA